MMSAPSLHPQPLLDNISPLTIMERNNGNNHKHQQPHLQMMSNGTAAHAAVSISASSASAPAAGNINTNNNGGSGKQHHQQQQGGHDHTNTVDYHEDEHKDCGDENNEDDNNLIGTATAASQREEEEEQDNTYGPQASEQEQPPALLLTIPALVGRGSPEEGLKNVANDTLTNCLQPVLNGLEQLDALSLLQCEPINATSSSSSGSIVSEGVQIRPLHDDVMPPIADPMTVRYLHLSEVPDQYSMGIFIFPPHARIPLHDHPGMCVLSRVLYGDVHRFSLDLARDDDVDAFPQTPPNPVATSSALSASLMNRNNTNTTISANNNNVNPPLPMSLPEGCKRAYKNRIDHLVAPGCTMLYPYEGNLHEFVAGPNGAGVLDVLLPPYDDSVQRDCTFYTIHEDYEFEQQQNNYKQASPTTSNNNSNGNNNDDNNKSRHACWIVPTGQPEDFHCISGRYKDMGA